MEAPSNPMHSPNANVSEIISNEHKSSKAVADSVCMSGTVSVGDTSLLCLFRLRLASLEGEQPVRFPNNLWIPGLQPR
jgi:hypothetical protein